MKERSQRLDGIMQKADRNESNFSQGGSYMQGSSFRRSCKKCLLRELPEDEYFQNLYDYMERLPEEDKVSEALYQERLTHCKECDYLQSGMCRICGCFVELRAVMKIRSCPKSPQEW